LFVVAPDGVSVAACGGSYWVLWSNGNFYEKEFLARFTAAFTCRLLSDFLKSSTCKTDLLFVVVVCESKPASW